MFDGFARVWTPVELAHRVGSKPVGLTVAGEPVVLFRGTDGALGALIDRCPHRGVKLSLGKVGATGCLECPFHGWRFDPHGACTHVPMSPDAKLSQLGATALPARELGGLVWVFTAPTRNPPELVVPEAIGSDRFVRAFLVKDWAAHWTRAMENMLDTPHLPFVHRRTIGRDMAKRLTETSRMEVGVTDTERGMRVDWSLDGAPGGGWLEYHRPNGMALHIPVDGRDLRMHVFCVPLGPRQTRMMVVGTRDFGRANPFLKLFDQFNRWILHEDQAVVESSQPPEVPPPEQEKSVPTDRATLRFRRYYFEALAHSSAGQPRPLEFVDATA